MSLFILFFFECNADTLDLHSFPTRRSSDLDTTTVVSKTTDANGEAMFENAAAGTVWVEASFTDAAGNRRKAPRSEEHTSELQSHVNLVCRLLLEKKKGRLFK